LLSVEQFSVASSALVDLVGLSSLQNVVNFSLLDAPALTGLQGLGSVSLSNLWLWNVPLTNLAGLEQVQVLGQGQLQINGAPQLTSLQGLPPLTALGSVNLADTPALEDMQALAGLTKLDTLFLQNTGLTNLDALGNVRQLAYLYVFDNPALVQMNGLGAATGLIELSIYNNDALQTWPGTPFLDQAGYITVSENAALTALPGFGSLHSAARLSIEDNPSLTDLELNNLESTGGLFIRGNAALDDQPLAPLRLLPNAQIKIISNLSGPARLSPCPWLQDGVCDEERGDCAAGTDTRDCRYL
jgi:hypothetical protein